MTTLDFTGVFSLAACLGVAAILAALCWWIYYSQLREVSSLLRWALPTLRAVAIVMCLLLLAGPIVRHRTWNGTPNQVTILLDATQSMQWHDGGAKSSEGYLSRLQRAVRLLLTDEPRLLSALSARSEITVSRFGGSSVVPLWRSALDNSQPLPDDERAWLPDKWGTPTAVGDVLSLQVRASGQNESATDTVPPDSDSASAGTDCVVLLTDGRSNAGRSPLEVAGQLAAEKRKLFIVGYGAADEPFDLAITAIRTPDRVLKSDVLRGELAWKDQFPAGHPVLLQVRAGDKVLWEQTVSSERCQQRTLKFAIPVSMIPLAAQPTERGTDTQEQTVTLRASIEAVSPPSTPSSAAEVSAEPAEVQQSNNSQTVHLRVVNRQYQILIVDSRARWETRYLRNALERDPNWRVDAFVIDPSDGVRPFSESSAEARLPQSLEQLLKYDLVVLGELPFVRCRPNGCRSCTAMSRTPAVG